MVEILIDSIKDVVRTVPLLFTAFLLVDFVIYRMNSGNKLVEKLSRYDCLGGGLLGIIPQCGISVAFARLYSNGYITLGMLMAVFLAGSDEALIILGVHPERLGLVAGLVFLKLVVAVTAGYTINILIMEKRNRIKGCAVDCKCPKCTRSVNIWHESIKHTVEVTLFLVLTVFLLNLGLEKIGEEAFYGLLGKNGFMQPVYAALVGAIPSCMSSVVLAEAYMKGAISLGSLAAGLCANTGYGILVVLKELRGIRLLRVLLLLFSISILTGEIIHFVM